MPALLMLERCLRIPTLLLLAAAAAAVEVLLEEGVEERMQMYLRVGQGIARHANEQPRELPEGLSWRETLNTRKLLLHFVRKQQTRALSAS